MKRKEDWIEMIVEKVANLIDEEYSNVDAHEKSILVKSIKDCFKEFEARLEEKEEGTLSKKYGHRAELPEDQWETIPPGMSLIDWFYLEDSEGESKK